MNKSERKRAVVAESERRAKASGLPDHLFVYRWLKHHSDEGGPRSYVPVKVSQMLDSRTYDPDLFPRLMQSAMNDGVPIELAPDNSRMYRDGRTPMADLCAWDELLILSPRASDALAPFLRRSCRPVPVRCATGTIFGYVVKTASKLIDETRSDIRWLRTSDKKKIAMSIAQYAFHPGQLERSPVFRIPLAKSDIFALAPVVETVRQHQLTGYRYQRVFPHPSAPIIISIPVKKSPPTREAPTLSFSSDARKVAVDSLTRLLGSPLKMDGRKPAALFAHRLPEMHMPTGAIVGVDLLLLEGRPFARRVKPGNYPLTLVVARASRDERIAFALLHFADRPVIAWEPATIDGNTKPRDGEGHGYAVESGHGGFCDAAAQEGLLDAEDPERSQARRIEKAMQKSYRHTREWVHVHTPKGDAALFSAGYGDGTYPSYFGLDKKGTPIVLLTDFGVLDWPRNPDQQHDKT